MKLYQVAIVTKGGKDIPATILLPPTAILAVDEKTAATKVLLENVDKLKPHNLDNVEVLVVPFA